MRGSPAAPPIPDSGRGEAEGASLSAEAGCGVWQDSPPREWDLRVGAGGGGTEPWPLLATGRGSEQNKKRPSSPFRGFRPGTCSGERQGGARLPVPQSGLGPLRPDPVFYRVPPPRRPRLASYPCRRPNLSGRLVEIWGRPGGEGASAPIRSRPKVKGAGEPLVVFPEHVGLCLSALMGSGAQKL